MKAFIISILFTSISAPVFSQYHTDLALKSLAEEDYIKALLYVNRDIENGDTDILTYVTRAIANSCLNNNQDAIEDVNTALKLFPKVNINYSDKAKLYDIRGHCYSELRQYKNAIDDALAALTCEVTGVRYYNLALLRIQSGDGSGGCKDLKISSDLGHQPAFVVLNDICR